MVSLRVTRLTKSQLNNQKKPEEEEETLTIVGALCKMDCVGPDLGRNKDNNYNCDKYGAFVCDKWEKKKQ